MNKSDLRKMIPGYRDLVSCARQEKSGLWLVGGFLRDFYLKDMPQSFDFDFIVSSRARFLAECFSRKKKARCIVLDEEEKTYRVILKKKNGIYTYDFAQRRGSCLKDDLLSRDFSVNTLALPMTGKKEDRIIDISGAAQDLKRKKIRALSCKNIRNDPLRILRAFSLATRLGMKIEKKTLTMLCREKKGLGLVSAERINEELFKILDNDYSYQTIRLMSEKRILDEIIPQVTACRGVYQGRYHHLDVWNHSLETLRCLELLYRRKLRNRGEIASYLDQELAGGRTVLQIIKLACLFHDLGKPIAKKIKKLKTIVYTHEKIGAQISGEIAEKLKMSAREKDCLQKLVFWHLRPGYLADTRKPSPRSLYRFFRDTDSYGGAVIILSLADWRATRGPLTDARRRARHERIMLSLLEQYFLRQTQPEAKPLLNGYDLMKRFKLTPGPFIGQILEKLREEQAMDNISTRKEAYALARTIIDKEKIRKVASGE